MHEELPIISRVAAVGIIVAAEYDHIEQFSRVYVCALYFELGAFHGTALFGLDPAVDAVLAK